jgi:methionyl-tRNA formyltransferase
VRTVFFGTPEVAVPALRALVTTTSVVAVVCQPDRPAGRTLKSLPCAVKVAAVELGLPVHQPLKVRNGEFADWLRAQHADLGVVLAYGRILPKDVLAAPRLGCVNLHASLLPKYRGAAPIQRALANGETVTGVSLMQMDEGLDTGPVFSRRSLPIAEDWDAGTLTEKMAALCAEMVSEELPRVFEGASTVPQDSLAATHAPPITAEETRLNWGLAAEQLHHLVRAFAPTPGAHTYCKGKRIKILKTRLGHFESQAAPPGTVICSRGNQLWIETGSVPLALERAQVEGKKALSAAELVNGRALVLGDRLGEP